MRTWEKMRKDRVRERERKRKEVDTCIDLNRKWHAVCWLLRRSFWNVLSQLDVIHTAPAPHTHFPCCPMALVPTNRQEHGHANSLRHPRTHTRLIPYCQNKQGRFSGKKLQTFVMHFTCVVLERSRKQLLLLDMFLSGRFWLHTEENRGSSGHASTLTQHSHCAHQHPDNYIITRRHREELKGPHEIMRGGGDKRKSSVVNCKSEIQWEQNDSAGMRKSREHFPPSELCCSRSASRLAGSMW